MDKSYLSSREESSLEGRCEGGAPLILSTLAFICIAFTLMNLSLNAYSLEEKRGEISQAVISITERLEESDAVAAFLGIGENDDKEIY